MENTKKVFLVEDDEIFTFLVQNRLEQMAGIELHTFQVGQDALQRLSEKPDVVFLDYSLPVMDGLDVLKNIKDDNDSIRVVMLSGMEHQKIVEECLEAGAEAFIQKDSKVAQKVHDKLVEMFGEAVS
jgi:two-component system response regulator AtoC